MSFAKKPHTHTHTLPSFYFHFYIANGPPASAFTAAAGELFIDRVGRHHGATGLGGWGAFLPLQTLGQLVGCFFFFFLSQLCLRRAPKTRQKETRVSSTVENAELSTVKRITDIPETQALHVPSPGRPRGCWRRGIAPSPRPRPFPPPPPTRPPAPPPPTSRLPPLPGLKPCLRSATCTAEGSQCHDRHDRAAPGGTTDAFFGGTGCAIGTEAFQKGEEGKQGLMLFQKTKQKTNPDRHTRGLGRSLFRPLQSTWRPGTT